MDALEEKRPHQAPGALAYQEPERRKTADQEEPPKEISQIPVQQQPMMQKQEQKSEPSSPLKIIFYIFGGLVSLAVYVFFWFVLIKNHQFSTDLKDQANDLEKSHSGANGTSGEISSFQDDLKIIQIFSIYTMVHLGLEPLIILSKRLSPTLSKFKGCFITDLSAFVAVMGLWIGNMIYLWSDYGLSGLYSGLTDEDLNEDYKDSRVVSKIIIWVIVGLWGLALFGSIGYAIFHKKQEKKDNYQEKQQEVEQQQQN